jgi:hypothetical protein
MLKNVEKKKLQSAEGNQEGKGRKHSIKKQKMDNFIEWFLPFPS